MVRRNINVALRYHESVSSLNMGRSARETGTPRSERGPLRKPVPRCSLLLNGPGKAIGLHLGPDLRHIMPEYDDIVGLAIDVPDMVAQQRLGLEAETLEQRDRGLLVDRHLHRHLFEPGIQGERKGLLR